MKQYLDYNATTPCFDETVDVMSRYLSVDFGNAGSRTHEAGLTAKKAISDARKDFQATWELHHLNLFLLVAQQKVTI